MQRFIGKKPNKKYVRPLYNNTMNKAVKVIENNEELIQDSTMNEKIEKIESILDAEKAPKRKVKVEKKDKGLFERTENSTILLTEDNKMLLND